MRGHVELYVAGALGLLLFGARVSYWGGQQGLAVFFELCPGWSMPSLHLIGAHA